ncbi:MAG: hypothetical protein SCK57_04250 [Bacillota bacterium]|nr:hypothetical protein [Bacillota bacterium]MDW7676852.1 hypothetical protein [Bacillota bacterium]
MNISQSRLSGSNTSSIYPPIRFNQKSRREAPSLVRQPAKVIPFYRAEKPSLLNNRKAYLLLHIAIGMALGASLVMTLVSFVMRFRIQRSFLSLIVTLAVYAAVTYYYHRIRRKTPRLFGRGLVVVALSAAPMLFLFLL